MPGCEPGGKGSTPFGYPGCSSRKSSTTRVCSWESRQPPKLLHGVRLLALVLLSRWCSGFALDPPKVQALVQIQVGILIHAACECAGSHGSARNCKTRFNSSAGCYEIYVLGVCWMGMQPCEG